MGVGGEFAMSGYEEMRPFSAGEVADNKRPCGELAALDYEGMRPISARVVEVRAQEGSGILFRQEGDKNGIFLRTQPLTSQKHRF